jgi:hypothetical protein
LIRGALQFGAEKKIFNAAKRPDRQAVQAFPAIGDQSLAEREGDQGG